MGQQLLQERSRAAIPCVVVRVVAGAAELGCLADVPQVPQALQGPTFGALVRTHHLLEWAVSGDRKCFQTDSVHGGRGGGSSSMCSGTPSPCGCMGNRGGIESCAVACIIKLLRSSFDDRK